MKWLKRVGLVLVAVLALFVFGWAPYWLAGLATIRRFTYNDRESAGNVSSFGFFEKQDVHAATALARARSQGPVVLWGVSLGAASATLAAAEDPGVAALVCDSSYRSLRDTVGHHLSLFRGFRW